MSYIYYTVGVLGIDAWFETIKYGDRLIQCHLSSTGKLKEIKWSLRAQIYIWNILVDKQNFNYGYFEMIGLEN